jgi:RNA polymerase sigma-70 factor, ECF subfamily
MTGAGASTLIWRIAAGEEPRVDEGRALLHGAIDGDRVARERVLADAARIALPVALRFLGDREDALEVCQEVMVRLHRSWQHLDPDRPLKPYVRQIAANVSRDRLSTARRRAPERARHELPAVASAEPPSDKVASRRQLLGSVQDCLDGLAPTERTAFTLRHVDGLAATEVALLMGCSASTARGYCHSARKRIRRYLATRHPDLEGASR